jgi:hypothetical protein
MGRGDGPRRGGDPTVDDRQTMDAVVPSVIVNIDKKPKQEKPKTVPAGPDQYAQSFDELSDSEDNAGIFDVVDVVNERDESGDAQEIDITELRTKEEARQAEEVAKKTRLAKFAETMKQRIANRKSRDDKQAEDLRKWMEENK